MSATTKPAPPKVTSVATREQGTIKREHTVTVQAKVVAVNQKTRVVTPRDSNGQDVTFVAGEEVRNLAQVRKGDMVTAVYHLAIAARLQRRPASSPRKAASEPRWARSRVGSVRAPCRSPRRGRRATRRRARWPSAA